MADVIVVINQPAVDMMMGWDGPLGRRMELCAREVTWRAKLMATKRTGKMAEQIDWKREVAKRGIVARIGTPVRYAAVQELGSKPHEIRPKKPGGMLVFHWAKVGHMVYLRRVWHPGTKPVRFLQRALERGVRSMF